MAARVQSAEAGIIAAEARIAVIAALQRQQRARLAERQQPTVRLVAALQTIARRPPALALVRPGSTDDLVHARAVLASVLPVVRARTAAVRGEVERGRALRLEADRTAAVLRQRQARLAGERDELARLAVERRRTSETLAGVAMLERDRALALGEESRDIAQLMSRMSDDASRSARLASLPGPVLRPAQPGLRRALPVASTAPESGQPPYRIPVTGRIVSGLGEVSDAGVRARGLTIATRPSAQVVAPRAGRIVFAGPFQGYANIVIVDHGGGWTTLVTSLAALDVRVGDRVDTGSPIGRAGSSRPTITVELRRGGTPVDIARLVG